MKDIIFPTRCPGCDMVLPFRYGKDYCPDCEKRIKKLCEKEYKKNLLCLYSYEGIIKESMYRFKYLNRRCYIEAYLLGADREIRDFLERKRPEVVIPVPMFYEKKKKRGYNQAEVISSGIKRLYALPEDKKALFRERETEALKKMSPAERTNNLKNAFKIRGNSIKWKRILLADDIYTTGATLSMCAAALFDAGAEEVSALCICGNRRIKGEEMED